MSEKLKKGAVRRIFGRYNPNDPAEKTLQDTADMWQHTAAPREAVVTTATHGRPQAQNEQARSFNKLAARTKMRRNPETGEREFLLHRGVGTSEANALRAGRPHQTVTSWTPSYSVAHRFAIDNTPVEEIRDPEHTPEKMAVKAQERVLSAWVPERHVSLYVNQVNPKGAYKDENEVIVTPHTYKMAHPQEVVDAKAGVGGTGVPKAEDRQATLRYKHQARLKRAMTSWHSLKKASEKPPAASSPSGWGTASPDEAEAVARIQHQAKDQNQKIVLSGLDDRERRWPPHNLGTYHGLEMKSLLPHPGSATSQVLFAARPGETQPRAILKDSAIPQLTPGGNPEKQSYFLHPNFQKAHREAAYQKLADEVFHLGQYVPKTAVFRHPKTGEPWSAQEMVPNAREVYTSDLEPLHQNGDLHKLAIMNTILGNHDRHENNLLKDPHGKVKMIDHGLAFDYSHVTTDIIPHYAHHILDEHVPDTVHHWLHELSGAKLGDHMHRLGAPTPIVLKALARLEEAKKWSHFIQDAERKGIKPENPGIGWLLEKLRLHQMGNQYADPELRSLKARQIDQKILGGSAVGPTEKGPFSSTIEQIQSRGNTQKRPA